MRFLRLIPLLLLALTLSCSNTEKEQQEKTETAQERMGREAAEQIKAPLEKAEMARSLQDQHNRSIEEALEKTAGQ